MLSVRDSILPDFDHEMAATRGVLERLPEASADWQPHVDSLSLGHLAVHLSEIPAWGLRILTRDGDELQTRGPDGRARDGLRASLLRAFDEHVRVVRARLVGMSDAELLAPWALTERGRLVVSMPRVAAFRRFVIHHTIHHRGQLSVYCQQHGVALPGLYGPSTSEVL